MNVMSFERLNSVDAMPQGGEIHIATYTKNESIYLDLSDDGTGMTEETKNRIFDPFFTMKGMDHSGLEMSMLYGTIKRHNGSIGIKTTLGKGTTFTIALPKGKEKIEKRDITQGSVVETKKLTY
jgi:signal transduction histidine kinase